MKSKKEMSRQELIKKARETLEKIYSHTSDEIAAYIDNAPTERIQFSVIPCFAYVMKLDDDFVDGVFELIGGESGDERFSKWTQKELRYAYDNAEALNGKWAGMHRQKLKKYMTA